MLNYLQEVILILYVFFVIAEVCIHVLLRNIPSTLAIHGPEEIHNIERFVVRQEFLLKLKVCSFRHFVRQETCEAPYACISLGSSFSIFFHSCFVLKSFLFPLLFVFLSVPLVLHSFPGCGV